MLGINLLLDLVTGLMNKFSGKELSLQRFSNPPVWQSTMSGNPTPGFTAAELTFAALRPATVGSTSPSSVSIYSYVSSITLPHLSIADEQVFYG